MLTVDLTEGSLYDLLADRCAIRVTAGRDDGGVGTDATAEQGARSRAVRERALDELARRVDELEPGSRPNLYVTLRPHAGQDGKEHQPYERLVR